MDTLLSLLVPAAILVGVSAIFALIYFIAENADRQVSSWLIFRRSLYFLLCQLILGLITVAVGTIALIGRLFLLDFLEGLRFGSASSVLIAVLVSAKLAISGYDYLAVRLAADMSRRRAPETTAATSQSPSRLLRGLLGAIRWSYSGLNQIMDRTYTSESIRASTLDRSRRRYAALLVQHLGQESIEIFQRVAEGLYRQKKKEARAKLGKKLTLAASANSDNDVRALHQMLQIMIDAGYGQQFTPRMARQLIRHHRIEATHGRRVLP